MSIMGGMGLSFREVYGHYIRKHDMPALTLDNLRRAAERLLADGDVELVARYTRQRRALMWVQAAPRTSAQIAALLGITPNHAAVLLRRMRQQGLIQSMGMVEGKRRPFHVYQAT